MKPLLVLLCLLGSAQLGRCQTNDALPAGTPRHIADYLSTATAAVLVSGDATHAILTAFGSSKAHEGRTKAVTTAVLCEALKYGAVNLEAISLKSLIHETRPDGSDRQSFPSEHSANAFAMPIEDWHGAVAAVSASVAVERTLADRHWWHDVFWGSVLGIGTRQLVRLIPACHDYV